MLSQKNPSKEFAWEKQLTIENEKDYFWDQKEQLVKFWANQNISELKKWGLDLIRLFQNKKSLKKHKNRIMELIPKLLQNENGYYYDQHKPIYFFRKNLASTYFSRDYFNMILAKEVGPIKIVIALEQKNHIERLQKFIEIDPIYHGMVNFDNKK